MERVLIQQIVSATNTKDMETLQMSSANKITWDITTILEHLYTNYSDVTNKELSSVRKVVEQLTVCPIEGVDVIFTKVDMLFALSEAYKLLSLKHKKMI